MNDTSYRLLLEKKAELDEEVAATAPYMSGVYDSAMKSLHNVAGTIGSAVKNKADYLAQDLARTKAMLPGIKSRMTEAYGNAASDIYDIGKHNISSIGSSIKDNANSLAKDFTATKAMLPGIKERASDALVKQIGGMDSTGAEYFTDAQIENANKALEVARRAHVSTVPQFVNQATKGISSAKDLVNTAKNTVQADTGPLGERPITSANDLINAAKYLNTASKQTTLEQARHGATDSIFQHKIVEDASKMLPSEAAARKSNALIAATNPEVLTPAQEAAENAATVETAQKVAPTLTQTIGNAVSNNLTGIGIGGLAGAGLGAYLGGKNHRTLGATLGGIAGAGIGGAAEHYLKQASIFAPTLTEKIAAEMSEAERKKLERIAINNLDKTQVARHIIAPLGAGATLGVLSGGNMPVGFIAPIVAGAGIGGYAGESIAKSISNTPGSRLIGGLAGGLLGYAGGTGASLMMYR